MFSVALAAQKKGNHMELLFMVTAILTLTLIAAFAIRRAEEK